jgi:hypothetical protein
MVQDADMRLQSRGLGRRWSARCKPAGLEYAGLHRGFADWETVMLG